MDRKSREKMLHDKLVDSYESVREKQINSRYYSLEWINHLLDLLPSKSYKRILDFGCGTGIAYELIKERYPDAEYVGIDLSESMIAVGKKKYPKVNFIAMDCENLLLEDNSFDLVIARSILHHIPNPDQAIAGINRVLVVGGNAIISEPQKTFITAWPREILKLTTGHFDKDHTNFTLNKFKSFFIKSGMTIKSIKFFGYLAYPFAFPDIIKIFKYFPANLFRLLYKFDLLIAEVPFINKFSWHIIVICKK